MNILQIYSPHLSDVFTLPCEIQKSHFQQYYPYMLLIIYVISEVLKTNCNLLAYPTWKCHHTNLWSAKLFHLTEGSLRSFKRWRLSCRRASCGLSSVALKRTGCGVWQLECQSSSVTASVQSDHLLRYYLFPVFFDKHFSEFLPARWRQKSTGIDIEQNYVTVTLCTACVCSDVQAGSVERRTRLRSTLLDRR